MDTRRFLNSKFIKARDISEPTAVTIKRADVIRKHSDEEQVAVKFSDFLPEKSLPLNVGNHKAVVKVTGSYDTDQWIGAKLEIFTESEPMADDGRGVRLRELSVEHLEHVPPALTTDKEAEFDDAIPF